MSKYFDKSNLAIYVGIIFFVALSYFSKLEYLKIFSSVAIPMCSAPFLYKELVEKGIKEKIKITTITTVSLIIFLLIINNIKNTRLFDNLFPIAVLSTGGIIFLKAYFKNNKMLLGIPFVWGVLFLLVYRGGI